MPFFEWDDRLSVNIQSVDRQHKVLIDHINKVASIANDGEKSKNDLVSAIDKLISYTKIHFSYEETIFNIYKYPDTKNHLINHNALFSTIERFKEKILIGDIQPGELLEFLKKWLETHILKEDKQYSAFLSGVVK